MNKVILTGRLCSDVDVKTAKSGKTVAKYRLAVNREGRQDGEQQADFLNCVVFDKGAEFAQKYLRKGVKIAIEGRIQTGSYDKDGVRHYTTDIMVQRCEFCESKGASSTDNVIKMPESSLPKSDVNGFVPVEDDEDLPF